MHMVAPTNVGHATGVVILAPTSHRGSRSYAFPVVAMTRGPSALRYLPCEGRRFAARPRFKDDGRPAGPRRMTGAADLAALPLP